MYDPLLPHFTTPSKGIASHAFLTSNQFSRNVVAGFLWQWVRPSAFRFYSILSANVEQALPRTSPSLVGFDQSRVSPPRDPVDPFIGGLLPWLAFQGPINHGIIFTTAVVVRLRLNQALNRGMLLTHAAEQCSTTAQQGLANHPYPTKHMSFIGRLACASVPSPTVPTATPLVNGVLVVHSGVLHKYFDPICKALAYSSLITPTDPAERAL